MRMYDIIAKKKNRGELTREEISFLIQGYVNGEIPDYQVSALLMAICLNGMTAEETAMLTMSMVHSGETVDLSSIDGIKVDKHSTGGVGDKTTLIAGPAAAACGVRIAKMSGRGLGHTGGTVDKMEAIPGIQTSLSQEAFFEVVRKVGISVIGQSGNLVPADKKLYALRDVTATVESIPLIASSIMSKKIAAGSDCILLDVKTGSGAFMKTEDEAVCLARAMVNIGEQVGKRTIALITNMDHPLGDAIGNALEITEVCQTLQGKGPQDLTDLCIELAANMCYLAQKGSMEQCREMAMSAIREGTGFQKLKEMVTAQGGDSSVLEKPEKFPKPGICYPVRAKQDGYLSRMDTEKCGMASVILGAGRTRKEDKIDHSAGILLKKKIGEFVHKDELIAEFYSSSEKMCQEAEQLFLGAMEMEKQAPKKQPLIYARVTAHGVEKFL